MEGYDTYGRSPPPPNRSSRGDEYRSADVYRERRRSPDRRDRDRKRSRSPAQIDRYQPDRAPRDDHYRRDDRRDRERRRSSPHPPAIDRYVPGQDPPAPALLINPLPNPLKLDFQVGFTWFAEWWRTEQRIKDDKERQRNNKPPPRVRGEREAREERDAERPKIQLAYDQYKENLHKSQAQAFVRLHKGEDWFRERYVPEVHEPFRRKLMDYRKGLFAQWEEQLSNGTFDQFTLEGIHKSESNGAGGVLEKEEGETSAAAEVLGVGDLLPSKGGDVRDPVSLQPTLLIKTVAPTVSRENFESFAKEHLGEGPGGYYHLSLSDPNPLKKCHRMGWIMLHTELPSDETLDDVDAIVDDAEQGETRGSAGAKKSAPFKTSEKALEKINGQTIEDAERGNFTLHCGVHRPPDAPRKKALWDLFSAPERIARDVELAVRLVRKLDNELGDEYFGAAKIEQRVQMLADQGALQGEVSRTPPKGAHDVNADMEEGEEDEGVVDEDEEDDEELLMKKKKLDLMVEYLRRVYNFCFFCVFESDSVHELQRKCPGGHLRRPRSSLTSAAKETARASASGEEFPLRKKQDKEDGEDGEMVDADSPAEEKKPSRRPSARNAQQLQRAFNWVKTFEEKILLLLEPDNVNLRKLGGTPLEDGVEEELNKFVKQEDVNKYRCKVPECTKLFKGVDFWRKHVEKRHVEWYEQIRKDVELVNTYVSDPAHIAPSRSDANSNGHFPLNNQAPTGTPRGFQLNHHFPVGFSGGPTGMGNAMNPGVFAAQPGMMGWSQNGAGMSGIGPVRGHGRNANGRVAGPYVRNDARGRMGSRGAGQGLGTEGGAGAMGPREAVVGRSLRSYEDLDADKDEGTGELNY